MGDRKMDLNDRHYKRWLSCGYTGEMTVNEYGWCNNELDRDTVKKLTVLKSKAVDAELGYAQLPNGKWVAGSSMMTNIGCCYGYGSSVSIWSKQYDTKGEAVTAELDRIRHGIDNNKKALTPDVESALSKLRNQFANAPIFDAFFGAGATFEQTALF